MVALGTTDASAQPLLRKAVKLAERFDTSVQLLHVLPPSLLPAGDDLERASSQLRSLVTCRQRREVDFDTIVVHDYPVADAIVREVLERKPDLLVASSHRHTKLTRALMDQTDWELIRNCPCPLWLSKSERVPRNLKILAAVDPFHSRAKPTRLDDVILRTALMAASDVAGQVIACHAYTPPATVTPAIAGELSYQPLSEEELRRFETTVRKRMDRLLARYDIPSSNRVTVMGDPASTIVLQARMQHASVVVMGAISRSALKRFFVGNTAEQVIDDLACDLLVVKSFDFRTPVSRHSRAVPAYPTAERTDRIIETRL